MAPVEHYPDRLLENLAQRRAAGVADPTVVLLTPGAYNSAYFEHAFLAQQMGIELVEGQDLFVRDDFVYMRTTRGPQRVDVIYRRIDDDFLDPLVFRPDSALGVPGLMSAYRAGRVTIANAIGTGHRRRQVDLSVRAGDDPLLPGRGAAARERADAASLRRPDDLAYALAHLERAGREGGPRCGRLRHADRTDGERGRARGLPAAHPGRAREATSRSRRSRSPPARPSSRQGVAPRHIDLRPFVLSGREITIVPGGLTRVALRDGLAGRQLVAGRRHQGHLGAGGLSVLSRTADHLYWMARYAERAENLARTLDVQYRAVAAAANRRADRARLGGARSTTLGFEDAYAERVTTTSTPHARDRLPGVRS